MPEYFPASARLLSIPRNCSAIAKPSAGRYLTAPATNSAMIKGIASALWSIFGGEEAEGRIGGETGEHADEGRRPGEKFDIPMTRTTTSSRNNPQQENIQHGNTDPNAKEDPDEAPSCTTQRRSDLLYTIREGEASSSTYPDVGCRTSTPAT